MRQKTSYKLPILGALTAAVIMLSVAAQAALVGDVNINGYTSTELTSAPGDPSEYTITPKIVTSIVTSGNFAGMVPSMYLNSTRGFGVATTSPYSQTLNG